VKKKLPILVVGAVLLAGGAYKTVLAKPAAPEPKPKVEGTVYVLPKEFLVNLDDGRYAKVSVGFVLSPHDTSSAPAGGGHGGGAVPPEGYGAMPQEAIVRDLVTDALTDASDRELISSPGRERLKKRILTAVRKHTDVDAEEVLFMDVTVQ
jgi:flagellar FliL protein